MDKKLEISLLLEFYGVLLTERQRELIDLYHNDDLSLAEISEIVGISRQGARDAIKKAESMLIAYEEKLGMYSLYSEREAIAEALAEKASALADRYRIASDDPDLAGLLNAVRALSGETEE